MRRTDKRRGGDLLFCATSLDGGAGGISAANGAIMSAMRRIATAYGSKLSTAGFYDQGLDAAAGFRGFAGDKARFALATLYAATRARLIVFDHVGLSFPAFAAPRLLRARTVIFAHGSEVGRRLRPRNAYALRRADRVATNSDLTLRRMRAAIGAEVGEVCLLGLPKRISATNAPPSADEAAHAREGLFLQAADGKPRSLGAEAALIVGRLDETEQEKGHRELIASMSLLLEHRPAAQLVIVGDGSDAAALKSLSAESPAAGSIFFAGRASDDLLTRLYRACAVYAMPSRQEGFGLVHLEAMNAAKPCLACREDGAAEVVVDGETGVLVANPPDPSEVASALAMLLADPATARRFGLAGWRRLQERFTAQAHQARVEALLVGALDGCATGTRSLEHTQ